MVPQFCTGYHVSRLTDFTDYDVSVTGLSPFVARLSRLFTCIIKSLRANPISLAATFGISVDFLPGYLDVSVPWFASCCYVFTTGYVLMHVGFPFRNFQTKRLLLPNLGLSQVITSFIASDCQGIHRARLVT